MKKEPGILFRYNSKRSSYLSFLVGFGMVGVIESLVVWIGTVAIAPGGWLEPAILIAHTSLIAWMARLFVGPLLTSHRLTATYLEVRYGFGFRARLPLESISGAKIVRERLVPPQPFLVFANPRKGRLHAAFSEEGQIWLYLDQLRSFRLGFFKRVLADRILINTDDRDKLLEALGFRPKATQENLDANTLRSESRV